ncbi:hypothetical protein F4781DRAFT_429187 [Annulohypoxylon bovei var. microspora]|nr:hypothetical protein F4781DRAFT_429187 [Annulohypoxylon bovei var. microspora]
MIQAAERASRKVIPCQIKRPLRFAVLVGALAAAWVSLVAFTRPGIVPWHPAEAITALLTPIQLPDWLISYSLSGKVSRTLAS